MRDSKKAADPDDELRTRLASNTPRPPPNGKHVLIAGVNDLNNRLFKQLVELQGCTTIVTRDGEEGLQVAINSHPDLIIVDVMGSDGFKLVRSLKGDERARDVPLIIVSAHPERAVLAAGCGDYDVFVEKPISVLNFRKIVDRLLLPTQTANSTPGQF